MNSGSWFWPDVSDMEGAEDACRLAKWCAIAVAGLTALWHWFRSQAQVLQAFVPSHFWTLPFSGSSRSAAIAGFALYLCERVYMIATTGSILGAGALEIVLDAPDIRRLSQPNP